LLLLEFLASGELGKTICGLGEVSPQDRTVKDASRFKRSRRYHSVGGCGSRRKTSILSLERYCIAIAFGGGLEAWGIAGQGLTTDP
jgi:hypothetical protein